MEVTLEHGTHDAAPTSFALGEDAAPDIGLFFGILARVRVATIDHECGMEARFDESGSR